MKESISSIVNETVRKLGDIAYAEAKRVCPVRTGRLKRSITKITVTSRNTGGTIVSIRTDVPYAGRVEFGSYSRRPKPFMQTGLDKARQSAADVLAWQIRKLHLTGDTK